MADIWIEAGIAAIKCLLVLLLVLNIAGMLGWVERKGSALIQDRIGANRASVFGFAGLGLINTMVADPIKILTKEDVVPAGADRLLHALAPCVNLLPALVTFAVIPFGDTLEMGGRSINLQIAPLDVGILFVLAMVSLGVYGVVLGGWASNNRWSLLGGIRGSAQMISYEIGMGLAIVSVVLTYGSLDLQTMTRAQGHLLFGWLPAWGVLYQPVAFLLLLTAGIAESKRMPFDLPEGESELVSGFFTEYSGAKHLMFFMTDFVEVILVAGLATTLFFGGWQVPYLGREGFLFPWGTTIALPHLVVVLLQFASFVVKVMFFCWFQIMIRWTLPRFRYDQLMRLGWKGLLPIGLVNVVVTAFLVLLVGGAA
ncbi:MAG: NADH-quinone oxidoreductase subunit H [Acidobacteria bacterium RBG_16_68_9]|nr:MAG: NADH-quinone oxidoreductase subunit H [Acidobacteria bacterium RBG_16_68_9]